MTEKEIDRKIVLSWLEGDYSITQLRILQEYLQDPAYRESLEKFLYEEWGASDVSALPPLPDLEQQYDKFRSQLPVREPVQSPVRRLPARRWVRIAAAAIVVFLVGMIWLLLRSGSAGKDNKTISWVVLNTAPGEKKTIQLPDSSLVYLGVASTLRYNAGYNSNNRSVFLEGEGYFVVRHGGRYPFTVNTGELTTIDIGTEFNIRHYAGQGAVEVTVAKGRVEVHNKRGGNESRIAALGQGQQLQYDSAAARAVTVSLPETSPVGGWRKGILVFRKQTLKEVTDELERYYNVSIRYANPAYTSILLTTLLDNRSLEEALDIVTVTAGVRYVRQGNTILLQ